MTCWCGENKAGEKKHKRKGEDACQASIDSRRAYDRARPKAPKRAGRWIPGTLILIPEWDPL